MENALTMLQHEQEPENVGAAQVRVTAEEFARAVARHQARREEAAQKLEGTVSLGEAVQELNIDITPEELLAEVQAARAEAQVAHVAPQVRRRPRWGLFAASAGLLAFFSVYSLRILVPVNSSLTTSPAVVQVTEPVTPSVVPVTAPDTILVQDTSGPKPVLRTLQEIPDNVSVRCGLTQTDGHTTLADFSNPNSAWTLIKHEGQVYIRGWIPAMSPQAIRTNGVTLYDRKELIPDGAAPQSVSLRLSTILAVPGQGDDEMIVTRTVLPDAHFGDHW